MVMTEEQRRIKVLDGIDALCYKYFFRLESKVKLRSIRGDDKDSVVDLSLREMYNKKTQKQCGKIANLTIRIKKLTEENQRLKNRLDKYERRAYVEQLENKISGKKR